jgi:uncharacterized protein (TIGR00255 family)
MTAISSMTAFARGDAAGDAGVAIVELRSVNHRYLDCHFKLPEDLRALETRMRETLGGELARGKVDCSLRFQSTRSDTLNLDESALAAVISASEAVAARLSDSAPLDPIALLNFPGVLRASEPAADSVQGLALEAFSSALASLSATRRSEGAQLEGLLEQRLDAIDAETSSLRQQLPALRDRLRERLTQRLAALAVEIDTGRLEQELVYHAQKSDVDEELDRLDAHVIAVREALAAGGPCGRRLDFLMQELQREANTLASKSNDSALTACAVELKVLIEQMREQVQNIE